jgi:hypothetical protein
MGNFALCVTSEEYGNDTYKPYDSYEEAAAGMKRIHDKGVELHDGVERWYRIVDLDTEDLDDDADEAE